MITSAAIRFCYDRAMSPMPTSTSARRPWPPFTGLAGFISLAGLAIGCGSVGSSTTIDAGDSDAAAVDAAPIDAAQTWSAYTNVVVNTTADIRCPVVSSDGLTLYYTATGGDSFDIWTATRATTSDGFGTPSQLANVNVSGVQQRYVEISDDGLELYFTAGDIAAINVATRASTAAAFSAPTAVGAGVVGNFPSISGDKLALYYIAQTTGANGELKRVSRTAVGQIWSAPQTIALDGAVQVYMTIDVSADELSIVRAPANNLANGPVVINRRAAKTGTFAGNELLPTLDVSTSPFPSARWGNHETEVWVGQPIAGSHEGVFVSKLQ